jgi:ribosomal protein S18 acetylase RimI-like enzyme
MSRNWPVSEAVHADSTGIASLFALSWTSPFSRLQFGDIDPLTLTTALAPRISQQIKARNLSFLVVHEPDTQNVVAVAQWTLPTEDPVTEETQDELDERQFLEDELYRKNLPVHSNKDLIMEFTVGLRALRTRLLRGRKHYLLDNLATHPDYRGRGLASHLIKWVLRKADAEGVLVYLETASDNSAAGLYQRLGFEEWGRYTIQDLGEFVAREELERCGSTTVHTHVAYVRYPTLVLEA